MIYNIQKYNCMNIKSNLSLEQLNKLCREHFKITSNTKTNVNIKINVDTLTYCSNLFYLNEPVWFIEIYKKVGKNKCFFFSNVIVSDNDGKVYDSCIPVSDIRGNTMLTLNEVVDIAEEYRKTIVEKYRDNYKLCISSILYQIDYVNSSNDYEPVWIIPVESEKGKIFSDPCHYIYISDYFGEIISIMNCHGREINI